MPAVWRGHRLLLPEPSLIRVCVNADEKERIRKYCRKKGVSYSHLCRTLVLGHIAREEGHEAAYATAQEGGAP